MAASCHPSARLPLASSRTSGLVRPLTTMAQPSPCPAEHSWLETSSLRVCFTAWSSIPRSPDAANRSIVMRWILECLKLMHWPRVRPRLSACSKTHPAILTRLLPCLHRRVLLPLTYRQLLKACNKPSTIPLLKWSFHISKPRQTLDCRLSSVPRLPRCHLNGARRSPRVACTATWPWPRSRWDLPCWPPLQPCLLKAISPGAAQSARPTARR